eukprot:2389288-Prymnesium_polylepis.1
MSVVVCRPLARAHAFDRAIARAPPPCGRRLHEPQLQRAVEARDAALAAEAAAARRLAASGDVVKQMEAQLVRLSEGFNRQVRP